VEDAAVHWPRGVQETDGEQFAQALCEVAPLREMVQGRARARVLRIGPRSCPLATGVLEPAVRVDHALAVPHIDCFLARGHWRAHRLRLEQTARVFDLNSIFFLFFIAQFFIPLIQKRMLEARRQAAIRAIEQSRHSRLITMIHRQETMSFLGFPIARYIDIEDSEEVLRAIRFTPPDMPIDLLLHTPGGLVLASEQIAFALKRREGKVTVFVPHYAMSGGTLIALAADEIVMDQNAVLGPVDPQLGTAQSSFAAASVLKALEQPNPNRDDTTLILGDLAEKALRQVHETVRKLLLEHQTEADAERIATAVASGQWTHDYPLDVDELRELGIKVSTELPRPVYDLMDFYPQSSQRRPGVEYIPIPYPQRAPEPSKSER
jgi:ClpP class serine protease